MNKIGNKLLLAILMLLIVLVVSSYEAAQVKMTLSEPKTLAGIGMAMIALAVKQTRKNNYNKKRRV